MSTTSAGGQGTDSLNGKLTFEQDKNRIVGRDADNLIRMLILANGNDFVMKVSEEGFDALTATDDHLIFDSGRRFLKIVDSGTGVFPTASTSVGGGGGWAQDIQHISISHSLGYAPIVLANINFTLEYSLTPVQINEVVTGGVNLINYNVTASATELIATTWLTINRSGSGSATQGGLPFKYYLLQETAS